MPYSRVTRTAYGADAIAYMRGHGKGHNGEEVRNQYITGVNMLPDSVVPFEQQMQLYWDRADPRHTTQIDRYVISFSPNELDRNNPEDLLKGLAIGCEFAKTIAPDCQTAIGVQTDGKGGKVHVHVDVNDVRMSDYKGLDSLAYVHWHFKPIVDRICAKYFTLDTPELAPERVNPSVRGARIKNEQIRAENAKEIRQAAAEGRTAKLKAEKYIWQDDLRERITRAAEGAADEDSFAKRLRLDGVELIPHVAKDGSTSYIHPATKKQPAYYLYELTDVTGFEGVIPQRALKSKSHKLGSNYQPEGIAQLFQSQPKAQTQAIEQKQKAPTQQELDKATRVARQTIWPSFAAAHGWETDRPDDQDEAKRRIKAWTGAWDDFIRWRIDQQTKRMTEGEMLPSIFDIQASGTVAVTEDILLEQFGNYLQDKKYQKSKEQAKQQTTSTDPEANQKRQKIKNQRTALAAEIQRNADYINEQAHKRQDEDKDEDYTGS